ncbi:transposase [Mucilaginibacter dorajii]|uniref:Transposase n=1 Tax=Mucilaginibacter dorajii TaxID=692994 RepID=A0ABP7PEI0_9SPHI|nr:transposase [Mucilaginibacter dorajii]MCS3734609.1 REP element-mobilizing transposase RayT [Mucilaginibacter dorajii]
MEDKFQNKYRTDSPRLSGWDYGSHGLYFITICTKPRLPYFGEVIIPEDPDNAFIKHSDIGKATHEHWLRIPEFHPYVQLDDFVIMPDHVHGILFFNKPDKTNWEPNKFGPQRNNLASVLRGYKGSLTKYSILNNIEFGWQPRYYDRVIRDQKEYNNIREYISQNPRNWLSDKNGFEKFYM